jgi:hypothetical protein
VTVTARIEGEVPIPPPAAAPPERQSRIMGLLSGPLLARDASRDSDGGKAF